MILYQFKLRSIDQTYGPLSLVEAVGVIYLGNQVCSLVSGTRYKDAFKLIVPVYLKR